MPRQDIFEQIKDIIHEQTRFQRDRVLVHQVGEVNIENMTFASASSVQEDEHNSHHTWYVMTASTGSNPSLTDFMRAYTFQRNGYMDIGASNGVAEFTNMSEDNAVLWYSTLQFAGSTAHVTLDINCQNYSCKIYVNGGLIDTGVNKLKKHISIVGGNHKVAVLFVGTGPYTSIEVHSHVDCFFRSEVVPNSPIWSGDPVASNGLIELKWANDPFASAWSLYRADGIPIGEIINANGNELTIAGELTVTGPLYTSVVKLGVVDDLTHNDGNTIITLDLDPGAPDLNTVIGEKAYKLGSFRSVNRFTDSGTNPIVWSDSTIYSPVNVYRLTAYGFITASTESEYSQRVEVFVPETDILRGPSLDVVPIEITATECVFDWSAVGDVMVSILGTTVSYDTGHSTALTGRVRAERPDSGGPGLFDFQGR